MYKRRNYEFNSSKVIMPTSERVDNICIQPIIQELQFTPKKTWKINRGLYQYMNIKRIDVFFCYTIERFVYECLLVEWTENGEMFFKRKLQTIFLSQIMLE